MAVVGPVTLAVTTTESFIPRGRDYLPSIGRGPFPKSVRCEWDTILRAAMSLQKECVKYYMSNPKGGIKWSHGTSPGQTLIVYRHVHVHTCSLPSLNWLPELTHYSAQRNGLLIMLYATGSKIDLEVGPGATRDFPGLITSNLTAVA